MAWLVWIFLTLLAIVSGYAVAAAVYPERGLSHRLVVLHIVTASLILTAVQACGYSGHLTPVPLGLFSLLLFGGTLFVAGRSAGWEHLRKMAIADVRTPGRVLQEAWQQREPAILIAIPASIAFGMSLLIAWTCRSWTFDPVWFHVPITGYAIQNGSLAWFDSHNGFISGYPNDVELLAAWNCIFPRDNRFDETSQFPFATLGVFLTVAWARHVGASRPVAAAAGAAWFALPPVFLLTHTSYVDIACNAGAAGAIYFSMTRPTARDRWMSLLAMGIFVGSKYSGAYQLVLLAPWFAARAAWEIWNTPGSRLRTLGSIALSIGGFTAVGLCKYIQNAIHVGNPVYPFRLKLPIVGIELAGPEVGFENVGAGGESKPWIFGSVADLQTLIDKWLIVKPNYTPEVHDGGFGPSFLWLALPCLVFVAGDVLRSRNWKKGLPLIILFVLVLRQPMSWWPRYTLAAPLAAMVALALIHTQLRVIWVRLGFSLVFLYLAWIGFRAGSDGYRDVYPQKVRRAWSASWEERAWMQLEPFQWPEHFARLRETELGPDDVITYDQSASFIAEYFSRDYHTRVTYVSSSGDPEAYVRRLRDLRARWAGVTQGSPAERAVQQAGGARLFVAPGTSSVLYRMPQ
ncbi:hypothetical protein [Pendulispora albinea]|uniref:Glycosyltransferase RgtA/B/C/D-like domain-containing protein n=1 Tax=Pendulispora albinea TaxID=2741071 RepID=A0ABZ2LU44_9BACT